METTKLYTFLNESGNIMTQVRAVNHDIAVSQANGWRKEEDGFIDFDTDFYSESISV